MLHPSPAKNIQTRLLSKVSSGARRLRASLSHLPLCRDVYHFSTDTLTFGKKTLCPPPSAQRAKNGTIGRPRGTSLKIAKSQHSNNFTLPQSVPHTAKDTPRLQSNLDAQLWVHQVPGLSASVDWGSSSGMIRRCPFNFQRLRSSSCTNARQLFTHLRRLKLRGLVLRHGSVSWFACVSQGEHSKSDLKVPHS